ncbi:MAG: ATP-binding protein [Spirochaetales bacterium]|nr:ATP-binding protein [Spirochaetales bacterium]
MVLYGARQTGKTTLVRGLLEKLPFRYLEINAYELRYIDALSSRNLITLKRLVAGYDLVFIDEAQRVPDIGINLKILHDGIPDLKIVATGSSSFELANRVSEPLTGRTWTHILYPVSVAELAQLHNPFEIQQLLDAILVFGSYPEIFSLENDREKEQYLREISVAYLYKDILELAGIRHSQKIRDLLRLIAFQTGSEVSIQELAVQLGMARDTVESYIDLLEKAFVIFRLPGFSKNLRKEVTKMKKIYFQDLGIRNVVIDNLLPLSQRNDAGRLWENFLVVERRKALAYAGMSTNAYFWRTYTGAELDYVEERGGQLNGFEMKFQPGKGRIPRSWYETYPQASGRVINLDNWIDFVMIQEPSGG